VAGVISWPGDRVLDLAAGQRDKSPDGESRQRRSFTAATTSKAWVSMARVTHRHQERLQDMTAVFGEGPMAAQSRG
jgi:hypothetical protein